MNSIYVEQKVYEIIDLKTVKVGKRRFRLSLDRKTLSKRKRKYRLWKRYMESKDGKVYAEYCRCRNQLRRMTRKATKLHEKEIAKRAKKDIKPFSSYVNSKTKLRSAIPPLHKNSNDHMAKDDTEEANVLGKFFSSVFVREPPLPDHDNENRQDNQNNRTEINITEDMLKKRLKDLEKDYD